MIRTKLSPLEKCLREDAPIPPDLIESVAGDIKDFIAQKTEEIRSKFQELYSRAGSDSRYTQDMENSLTRELKDKGYTVTKSGGGVLSSLMNVIVYPIAKVIEKIARYVITPKVFQSVDTQWDQRDLGIVDMFLLACAVVSMTYMNWPLAVVFLGLKGSFKFTQDVVAKVAISESWEPPDEPMRLDEGLSDIIKFFTGNKKAIATKYNELAMDAQDRAFLEYQDRLLRDRLRQQGYDVESTATDQGWYRQWTEYLSDKLIKFLRDMFWPASRDNPLNLGIEILLIAGGLLATTLGQWQIALTCAVLKKYVNTALREEQQAPVSREEAIRRLICEGSSF